MIVDFHTHTFPARIAKKTIAYLAGKAHIVPQSDGTKAGLRTSMKEAGVDLSVILPIATTVKHVHEINDVARDTNREGDGLYSLATLHPQQEDWEAELDRIVADGFCGIKIHPYYQETNLDDERYLRIIRRADAAGLFVLTHTGDDVGNPGLAYCTPEMARNVMDRTGASKMIFAHMGGWHAWERAAELLADTGCYLDTAFSIGRFEPFADEYHNEESCRFLSPAEFCDMVALFGADHVLFGTDSPWAGQEQAIAWIRAAGLSEEDTGAILGGNAKQLLKLV